MTNTIPTDITVLKQLIALRLDVNIWSARKKLTPADFGTLDLPPEKLASLGSKKVCNPEDLRVFATLNPNTDKAIRDFQQDNGLQVDGVLKPGGPTIAKLGGLLGGRAEANSFVSELPPVGENPDSRYRQTPPTFPGFRPQLNGTRKPADLLSILLG